MNARNQCINLRVEVRQIREAVSCLIDSTLLHRVVGKFKYDPKNLKNYSLGSIGIEEVALKEINLTYVRVNSPELVAVVDKEVHRYVNSIQHLDSINDGLLYRSPRGEQGTGNEKNDPLISTKLQLEFYQVKKKKIFNIIENDDTLPWEIWTFGLDVVKTKQESDYVQMREDVGEKLGEQVLNICNFVNQPKMYMPSTPLHADLPLVYDNRFSDIQPYLFRLNFKDQETAPETLGGNVRKFLSAMTK
uniref:Autophagy-related protein 101 n=1 Tax=Panagrolaimus sp. ES5 TaxID=591445 RepID=A0AC34FKS2_9BILA